MRTEAMRYSRKATPCVGTESGRFYIETGFIEVYGVHLTESGEVTTAVRISKKQLERAIAVMDRAGDSHK